MDKSKQQQLAVIVQSLYLCNLLLIPLLSFIVLLVYFQRYKHSHGVLKIHLYRAIQLTLLAGFCVILLPLLVILLSNSLQTSLMIMLVYMITMHAIFVLLGMFNISRAMANKLPIF